MPTHKIMVSSTYTELMEHRAAVIEAVNAEKAVPLAMEFDASLPHDLIKASLDKVNEADGYFGLIGDRYGQTPVDPDRNPLGLSLTELEYRRAVERGIPRCVLIIGELYVVSPRNVRSVDADKLDNFIARVKKDIICAEFTSLVDLRSKARRSVTALCRELDKTRPEPPPEPPKPPTIRAVPSPPAFYAHPAYIPGYPFQGREKELAALHDWAGSADPVMVFEAIGGMGKSMLTWEWVTHHANHDGPGWAGVLWYSFYERGADMHDFCATALGYIVQTDPKTLESQPTAVLAESLLSHLHARPYLLILDGLERVLIAYHRSDAAQLADDAVDAAEDPANPNRAPTNCIRPEDGELLRQFRAAAPSKILISSRLMPRELLNPGGQTPPGVRRLSLTGLDPRDAEAMLRATGVSGDSMAMRRYLERTFGGHPLILGVASGQILRYPRAPGDFDRWSQDPDGGAAPDLTHPDIRQRRTHILKVAFDGLDAPTKSLLARIAMISDAVGYEVLEVLNPARPAPPKEVTEPSPPDLDRDFRTRRLRDRLAAEKTLDARAELERQIAARQRSLRDEYEQARAAHKTYRAALSAWRASPPVRQARLWLDRALTALETAGLLQHDRNERAYDLHPVVRGYTIGSLEAETRAETGQRVADYFATRPKPAFETTTSVKDLADGVQTVRTLNLAGKTQQAWDVLNAGLRDALFRLEQHYETLALLRPVFPDGWAAAPTGIDNPGLVANVAGNALKAVGMRREAAAQEVFTVQDAVRKGLSGELSTRLQNLSVTAAGNRELARSERLLRLARAVAQAAADKTGTVWCDLFLVHDLTSRGVLAEARELSTTLAASLPDAARGNTQLEALALNNEVRLGLRDGGLTHDRLDGALSRVRVLGRPYYERAVLGLAGQWHQTQGDHAAAEAAFGSAIAMAHAAGLSDTRCEAARGLSLFHLGRTDAARDAAASAEHAPPHDDLARLYLALGDRDAARRHALAGFEWYWADGPPYTVDCWLQPCREVLRELGEPEPVLPPFDPAKVVPYPFEAEIERLLAEHAAGKKPG